MMARLRRALACIIFSCRDPNNCGCKDDPPLHWTMPVAPTGWRCPNCGAGMAPTETRCPCVDMKKGPTCG